jgi:hypothetical protein
MHRAKDGSQRGFMSHWVTPNILMTYDSRNQTFYVGLNTTFAIQAAGLDGKIIRIIEKPFEKIKLSRKDKEKVVPYRGASQNWMINVCPDHLVVLSDIGVMPGGHLAAFRFVSVEKSEIYIFDAQGQFIYTVSLPDGINLREPIFFKSGIAGVVYGADKIVYVEYNIKNLPGIFHR